MTTAADFKKQVGKYFGLEMRKLGFKGTGFDYFQETEDFLFAITIGGKTGAAGMCSISMAVHPKVVNRNTFDEKLLNFKKLAFYHYEFRMSLGEESKFWDFSDKEEDNFKTINEILDLIKAKALPVFEQFQAGLLNTFTTDDLDTFFDSFENKTGVKHIVTSDIRFAWVMALYYENKNHVKSKAFANYALSKLSNSQWFGGKDIKRILNQNSG